MKIFLFLAFIVSSYSYAQSGHDHQSDTKKKGDHHSEMHDGEHHG
ncbi:MAG: cytochrome-c peroxidase, partial [Nitrosomonadaceae bacterium]|nr:cytochrome-c peroxidase [Nitrosomonadaceae bacterium]